MFYKFIDNFLTIDECNFIIDLGNSIGLKKMTSSKFVNGVYTETALNEYTNKRMGCYFVNDILRLSKVKAITNKTITKLNELKPFNGIEYIGVPKYSFNRYSNGDFLDWHSDSHEIMYGASSTVIFQLNENYEGGDIVYIIDGVEHRIPKKQGSIFIFDSNILHCVNKITNGIRYSLNVWPSGEIKKSFI